MAVPFGKLNTAVHKSIEDNEHRSILIKFIKIFVKVGLKNVISDFDSGMVGKSYLKDGPTILMSCVPDNPINADLYLVKTTVTMQQVLNRSEALNAVLHKIAESAVRGNQSIVLFRINRFGWCVAYNFEDPVRNSYPFICMNGTGAGQDSIRIRTLDSFSKINERSK